jgi:hypothetical protein
MTGSGHSSKRLLNRMATVFLAAVALTGPVACHHRGDPDVSDDESREPTTIQVTNQGFPDMTIYVLSTGGQRLRLGLANGNSTVTFVIPSAMVTGGATPLRFIADPIGGSRASVGEQITVSPGDQVQLTIPPV